ncbi:MAG: AMP-binding protein, partial [Salinisphaera sp.]|nr:AMP-binding protein [Salinisphaera sp.]
MIPKADSYEEVYRRFQWSLPERFNIARAVCDRHATDPKRIALIYEDAAGRVERISFRQLQQMANRWANTAVGALGLQRGERVAILLPVHPAVTAVHIGCWKAGLVSCPMSVLFGPDGLAYRLENCGARAIVTDAAHLETVLGIREHCPQLEHVFVI